MKKILKPRLENFILKTTHDLLTSRGFYLIEEINYETYVIDFYKKFLQKVEEVYNDISNTQIKPLIKIVYTKTNTETLRSSNLGSFVLDKKDLTKEEFIFERLELDNSTYDNQKEKEIEIDKTCIIVFPSNIPYGLSYEIERKNEYLLDFLSNLIYDYYKKIGYNKNINNFSKSYISITLMKRIYAIVY